MKIKIKFFLVFCASFLEIYASQSNKQQLLLSSRRYDMYGYKTSKQKSVITAVYSNDPSEQRWLTPIEIAVVSFNLAELKRILSNAIASDEHLEMNKAFQISHKIQVSTNNSERIKERCEQMQFLLTASLVQDVSEPTIS